MKVDIQPLIDDLISELDDIQKLFNERLEDLKTENKKYGTAIALVQQVQQTDSILRELSQKARDKQPTLRYLQDKIVEQNTNINTKAKRTLIEKRKT